MIKHILFDPYGYLDGASITTSFQNLLSLSDDADVLLVFNTLDQPVILNLPSKSEKATAISYVQMRLPKGANLALDARTNNKRFCKGIIQIKAVSTIPTTGTEITITALR